MKTYNSTVCIMCCMKQDLNSSQPPQSPCFSCSEALLQYQSEVLVQTFAWCCMWTLFFYLFVYVHSLQHECV